MAKSEKTLAQFPPGASIGGVDVNAALEARYKRGLYLGLVIGIVIGVILGFVL